jgi:hypothetical protein
VYIIKDMSLNTFNINNPKVSSVGGLIDAEFKTLKAGEFEVDQLNVNGSITAQAVLTDQLAVANTIFPIVTAGERNLVLESNDLQELVYTKYNLLGIVAPTTVSLVNNVSTEVVGPTSTDFTGSWNIENLQDLQTYKLTAECRFISPNPGNVIFRPTIGSVVLATVTQALPVNNLTQQMTFELTFSILSGAGTTSTQITHSSKMQYRNASTPTLNQIGTNGTGPIDTSTPQGTVPSINLEYSLPGLDLTVDEFSFNRIY